MYLADFGEFNWMTIDEIKLLPFCFTKLPQLAIKGKLYGKWFSGLFNSFLGQPVTHCDILQMESVVFYCYFEMEHIHILLVLCWVNYWAKIYQILFVVCLRKGEGLKDGVNVCFPLC